MNTLTLAATLALSVQYLEEAWLSLRRPIVLVITYYRSEPPNLRRLE